MQATLTARCAQFAENRERFKRCLPWGHAAMYPIGAALFAQRGELVSEEQLRRCKTLLKESVSGFSNFRGTAEIGMIAMLASDPYPQRRLDRALQIYAALKVHFFSGSYLPVAAMLFAENTPEGGEAALASRTRGLYDRMKAEHPFLTSGEDSVYAALLALSPTEDDVLIREVEACYGRLQEVFRQPNAVQSLSHVLALCGGTAEEKVDRTVALFRALKESGNRYGTGYELATLGVLASLPMPLEEIRAQLLEVDALLSTQKGYGFWGLSRTQRLMHAGMLLTGEILGESSILHSAALNGTVAWIAAQQAAMCAVIAASAASSASH